MYSQVDWCLFASLIPRARGTWDIFDGLPVHCSEMLQTPEHAVEFFSGAVPVIWWMHTGPSSQCTRNISVSLLAEFQHAMVVVRLCAPCAALTEAGLSSGCDWAVRVANLHNWSEKQHVNQMVFHSWGNQFFHFNWYLLGAGYVLGMFQMLGIQ